MDIDNSKGLLSLLDGGMSIVEAATKVAADLVGLPVGTVKPGLLADFVLLNRNPLDESTLRTLSKEDITNVWVGGVEAYSAE